MPQPRLFLGIRGHREGKCGYNSAQVLAGKSSAAHEAAKRRDAVQQNASDCDSLSPKQQQALAALLTGLSVTDAAIAAAVDRTTLHRWLKDDYSFRIALIHERRLYREAMQRRLMGLAEKAAENVAASVARGDSRISLSVLRSLGLLQPPKDGEEDPQDLLWQSAVAEWNRIDPVNKELCRRRMR